MSGSDFDSHNWITSSPEKKLCVCVLIFIITYKRLFSIQIYKHNIQIKHTTLFIVNSIQKWILLRLL